MSCVDRETFVWGAGYYRPYSGFAIEMAFRWPTDCGPTLNADFLALRVLVGSEPVFLDGDVPRSPSYGVYISQLIRFARGCSNVDDFNNRNLCLTAKLLKQGYRYHKIRKAFSKFYHRHSELIVKYNIGLKTILQQGISEPVFYGDLVYKFKRIVGKPNFSDQFIKIVKRYIRV